MSEMNKYGEQCASGSTAAHTHTPGCTSRHTRAPILCGRRDVAGSLCLFPHMHDGAHRYGRPDDMEAQCDVCGEGESTHGTGHKFTYTGRYTKRHASPAEALIVEVRGTSVSVATEGADDTAAAVLVATAINDISRASCSCASLRAQGLNAYCSNCPPSPAEAAIYERGGYVLSIIPDPSLPPGHGFMPNPAAAPPVYIDAEARAFWVAGGGTSTEAEAMERVRGGCAPSDDAGRAALRKATEERIAELSRRIYEADARRTNAPRSGGPIVGLDAMLPPLTPAATLGEAVELLARAERLCHDAGRSRVAGLIGRVRADLNGDRDVIEARSSVRQPSTVEGELNPASNSCWMSLRDPTPHELGTGAHCLMCEAMREAKLREDNAPDVG